MNFGNSENSGNFFPKKAYEISYALLRVASVARFQGFGDCLCNQAFLLLDFAARGQNSECSKIAESMEYLLRLGGDMGIIHIRNAESIIQEVRKFNSAIAEYEKLKDEPALINLDASFSEASARSSDVKDSSVHAVLSPIVQQNSNQIPLAHEGFGQEQRENISTVAKSATRQSAILEVIRQNGNCRLKDVQDYFHDVSERTIRYDLQDLVERGSLVRVGNGGPSTYYKANQVHTGRGEVVRQA